VGKAQVQAMLVASRVVAAGEPLPEVLDAIAANAVAVADGARAASIALVTGPDEPWRIAGSYGLSEGYPELVHRWPTSPQPGRTLAQAQLTLEPGRPVIVTDTETDERFGAWRELARAESFRGYLSVPLAADDLLLGALNVFRAEPGRWPDTQVDLMTFFAEHAAIAIRIAQLLDRQTREVAGLRRLVRALEEQGHERANRLHTVSGLLALDAVSEAREFIETLEDAHHDMTAAVVTRISHPVLAGLLLAESSIAHQRSIRLEIDPSSQVDRVPPALGDAQLVTIVGNLLDNAFDAVAQLPMSRRRVELAATSGDERLTVRVRDWGVGLPGTIDEVFERGVTTKSGHPGVGMTLVRDSVQAAGGTVVARRHRSGTSFTVAVPFA
jgi:anti-sigma regulatory factor (Ser/Thr protein kinase)